AIMQKINVASIATRWVLTSNKANASAESVGFFMADPPSQMLCAQPPIWRAKDRVGRRSNVRFGSKADICAAQRHVRFTHDSDHESDITTKITRKKSEKNLLNLRPVYCARSGENVALGLSSTWPTCPAPSTRAGLFFAARHAASGSA